MELIVRNAKTRDADKLVDIGIENGRIVKIAEKISETANEEIAADGNLVTPSLVDIHVHMDAALTVGQPRHNVTGTLLEGIQIWSERKPSLNINDVKQRAIKAIKWEIAHGVTKIRSHVDVCDPSLTALKGLLEVKKELADMVELQLVAFPQDGIQSYPGGEELMIKAVEAGADVVGGIPHYEWTREDGVKDVQTAMEIATNYGRLVDIHCDETDDEHSRFVEVVAAETIKKKYSGKVTASHTTAFHSYSNAYAFKLIGWIKRAGLHMVTNPLDNAVLQGRFDTYPKRRGHTRVKELLEAGVNVCIGHDSIMDPWYPLGMGDPLQPAFVLVHYGQMSGYHEMLQLFDMITINGAKAFGDTDNYGIAEGKKADLVVFDAKTEMDALRTLAPRLYVVKNGHVVSKTMPQQTFLRTMATWEKIDFVK